jgi:mRNA interferase RelE/StbE
LNTDELKFLVSAKKEWDKLDNTVRQQLKRKLVERRANPRVESARLNAMLNCYKIKLASSGYRLVYKVVDREVTVTVIAIEKPEQSAVYSITHNRILQ